MRHSSLFHRLGQVSSILTESPKGGCGRSSSPAARKVSRIERASYVFVWIVVEAHLFPDLACHLPFYDDSSLDRSRCGWST